MITIYFVVVVDTRTPWLPKWLAIFGLISANLMTAEHRISAMANTQWKYCMSSYFQQKSAHFGAIPY